MASGRSISHTDGDSSVLEVRHGVVGYNLPVGSVASPYGSAHDVQQVCEIPPRFRYNIEYRIQLQYLD